MRFGRLRGGLEKKGSGPGGLQGGVQNVKNMILGPLSFYPKRSGAYKYSGFSVFQKNVFFSNSVLQILRGGQGGSQDVRWAPQKFPRGPSGKWHGSKGALFGGSWIGKSSPGLDF